MRLNILPPRLLLCRDWNAISSGEVCNAGKKQGGLQQKCLLTFFLGLKASKGPFFCKTRKQENKPLYGDLAKSPFALILQKLAERAWVLTDTSALPGVQRASYSIYKPLLSRQRNLQPSWETGLNPCQSYKRAVPFLLTRENRGDSDKTCSLRWGG